MVRLFRGTCEAVRAMHTYRAPISAQTKNGHAIPAALSSAQNRVADHEDDHDDQLLPQPEGDAEGGYSYDGASVPLITRRHVESQGDVVFDGDEELEQLNTDQPPEEGSKTEIVPYAHRDIKPG